MNFYLVWVRSARYRGKEPLTYHADTSLQPGSLVRVSLQRESVLGVVSEVTSRPKFATKPINEVLPLPPLPLHLLKLSEWMLEFYATTLGVATQQFLPRNITKHTDATPQPFTQPAVSRLPALTTDQQTAIATITTPNTYLLHGKTGSGKTRIYIELAIRTLQAGGSAIVLTPEISLTSQLAQNFAAVFGPRVVVLHSQLTPAERQRAWITILTSKVPLVVIGPRSVLFSPLQSIGLIVVDESHEGAYKQEQAPYYHASRVAAQLAQLHHAILILGSATPAITDYYIAEQKHKPIIRLNQLAQTGLAPTKYTIVDFKDRSLFGYTAHLSQPLIDAVRLALERKEQVLVYLNRRGTARLVICEHCGWQSLCPRCDLPLIYHGDSHELRCHTCGYRQSPPAACPVCSHASVMFKSAGTKAIADEVQHIFPNARLQRFDTDNKKSERLEQQYDTIRRGDIDILVGTQLLAKGLDLPKLSTVGIVLADTSLYVPDFSAQERTYQLLTQVLGRIGRGHREGHAIIQTYHPDHPVLAAALKDDWTTFYETELAERSKYLFPPFCYLLKLTCRRASSRSAEQNAIQLKDHILRTIPGVRVDGPAPSFHQKVEKQYQWQLVVKATRRSSLLRVLQLLPSSGWTYDIDPVNLL